MNLKHIIQTAILGTSVFASGCKVIPHGEYSPAIVVQPRMYPRETPPDCLQRAEEQPYHSRNYKGDLPHKK